MPRYEVTAKEVVWLRAVIEAEDEDELRECEDEWEAELVEFDGSLEIDSVRELKDKS